MLNNVKTCWGHIYQITKKIDFFLYLFVIFTLRFAKMILFFCIVWCHHLSWETEAFPSKSSKKTGVSKTSVTCEVMIRFSWDFDRIIICSFFLLDTFLITNKQRLLLRNVLQLPQLCKLYSMSCLCTYKS